MDTTMVMVALFISARARAPPTSLSVPRVRGVCHASCSRRVGGGCARCNRSPVSSNNRCADLSFPIKRSVSRIPISPLNTVVTICVSDRQSPVT